MKVALGCNKDGAICIIIIAFRGICQGILCVKDVVIVHYSRLSILVGAVVRLGAKEC